MQLFKSVYFNDFPAKNARGKSLKLAFGKSDESLFGAVRSLSSEDIRAMFGLNSYTEIKENASTAGSSINSYCLNLLRKAVESQGSQDQLKLDLEISSAGQMIDPIQATFKGGRAESLQSWYPYLEGYSPDFVSTVLRSFAPKAKRILDPFAGTGTTPLTTSRAGLDSFYCELNPLLQLLIEAKSSALSLDEKQRKKLVTSIRDLADSLPNSLDSLEPDVRLGINYKNTFGSSVFFPEPTLEKCLKIRTLVDSSSIVNQVLASILTVATVSALIPCSYLIRRGDLRFRKGKEKDNIEMDITSLISKNMRLIADDIGSIKQAKALPLLVAGDAKRLNKVADLGIDAIVTSPPYLNGTNYYRNTKLELWFLRALLSGKDLSTFRKQTVTAGINDVSGPKSDPVLKSIESLIASLDESAYDRRIPQMVSDYFADMKKVFDGLLCQAKPGASLLIDIGDSAYAGVWVDTPKILTELLQSEGWNVSSEIPLRHRLSRSGQPLRQVLISANAPKRKLSSKKPTVAWRSKWTRFKKDLPHQKNDYAKRNWGSSLHSLCSYQGKMKPSLAHHLVKTFLKPGDSMLDPFGGVGTIPFEAAQLGIHSWNFDISPAALPIASAKLGIAVADECETLICQLERYIKSHRATKKEISEAESIKFNGVLSDYFHSKTFNEILLARRFFKINPPSTSSSALVFSSLLHILHGNRPYALSRRSHPITPFAPTGDTEYKNLVVKLREKVSRSLAVERGKGFVEGKSIFQDATYLWPQEVDELDAVITSPPFFDSTRFYLANWMRLWFSGWVDNDFKERPLAFVDERQKKDFNVYEPILRQARERLKIGGVCVFHLGKSKKCDMALEVQRTSRPWFKNSEIFAESVAHCESHGIRDKGTVVDHTYLVLS